jgi:hypothetical protein
MGLLIALIGCAIGRPSRGGALTLAYFLGLSLIHVPGVLPFLDSATGLPDWEETQIGFEMTIFGMAAFVAGAVLARWTDGPGPTEMSAPPHWRALWLQRLGRRALTLGVVCYFVIMPVSARVPSATSIVSSLGTLLIVGLWLALYSAAVAADWKRTLGTLALLPLLPMATLVMGGFLGYGTYWVLSIITFLFVLARRRIWFYIGAPVAIFFGLSLFVSYMGQRDAIRDVAWDGRTSVLDRLDRASAIITDFQLLDLASPDHITALDGRLNQNWLVGAAVIYHENGAAPFDYGGTVPLWALIPRAIWPDKPQVGGGLDVVTKFTGILFAEGVSVGAGQVLEFYVNFGVPGVLIGFLGLGFLLMRLDKGIMHSLGAGDMRGFLLRAIPGLMLMQPGGNLLEILVSCVAGYLTAHLVILSRSLDVSLATRPRWQGA